MLLLRASSSPRVGCQHSGRRGVGAGLSQRLYTDDREGASEGGRLAAFNSRHCNPKQYQRATLGVFFIKILSVYHLCIGSTVAQEIEGPITERFVVDSVSNSASTHSVVVPFGKTLDPVVPNLCRK